MLSRFNTSVVVIGTVALLSLPACSSDEDSGPVSAGNGQPPVISSVSWTQDPGCSPNNSSAVTIVTTATDPDTPGANLTYTGQVSSCSPGINSASAVVTCPQAGAYNGNVTVKDPEGNSHSMSFSFGPCQDGQKP